ncbi:MAG: HD domain-containing protein [Bacteroidales bacterium]
MDRIQQIADIAKDHFTNAKGSHRWDHTLRVMNLSEHIGRLENADMEVVRISALLHDIGRTKEDKSNGAVDHAFEGAKMARDILQKFRISTEKLENIVHCIETHRFRGEKRPKTIEAKVLFDADKLDSIGAVGIGRAFLFAGEVGAKLHDENVDVKKTKPYTKDDTAYREYLVKLRKIKDRVLTDEGKRLAEERHKFMSGFFDRLNKEVRGEV